MLPASVRKSIRRRTYDQSRSISVIQGDFAKHYEKVKVLGQGADGITYLVNKLGTKEAEEHEFVAKEAHDFTPEGLRKFKEEFQKLKELRHPQVLKVWEMIEEAEVLVNGELRNQNYVITDYARGGDLYHYLRKVVEHRALTEEWAAGVFKQAMNGVVFLHRNGVVHNDLKPDNILMNGAFSPTEPGKVPLVVLTDFGRATLARDMGFSHGDPRYQSPETWRVLQAMWDDDQYVDLELQMGFKADVWSMGATLYEVLSGGKIPFLYRACDLMELMDSEDISREMREALWDARPVRVRPYCVGASSEAESLLLQLMAKEPDERPSALNALKHPWFSVKGRPIDDVLSKGLRFNAQKGEAHAMLLSALASQVTSEHYKECAEAFGQVDDNNSGTLNLTEFKLAFKTSSTKSSSFGGAISDEELERMFRIADIDKNGKLSFEEFMAVTFDWRTVDPKILDSKLDRLFRDMDTDGNGSIDPDELGRAFHGVLSNQELAEIFTLIDRDGDGRVSLKELHDFLFKPMTEEDRLVIANVSRLRATHRDRFACLAKCLEGLCGGR